MTSVCYTASATSLDPNAAFSSRPDPYIYESLIWASTPISKIALEQNWLSMEKNRIVAKLSADMHAEVISGFLSDTLEEGVFRKYDSDVQGQIAIIGAVVYTLPVNGVQHAEQFILSSVDPATGVRDYHPHTNEQLYELMKDLGTFSTDIMTKLQTKIFQVMSTNSGNVEADLATIYSITWNS